MAKKAATKSSKPSSAKGAKPAAKGAGKAKSKPAKSVSHDAALGEGGKNDAGSALLFPDDMPKESAAAPSGDSSAEAAAGSPDTESAVASQPRVFPTKAELKILYARYTEGSPLDEHDKAFYFVLDVGGVSRAKQLIAHVEEVLHELEEFGG